MSKKKQPSILSRKHGKALAELSAWLKEQKRGYEAWGSLGKRETDQINRWLLALRAINKQHLTARWWDDE